MECWGSPRADVAIVEVLCVVVCDCGALKDPCWCCGSVVCPRGQR